MNAVPHLTLEVRTDLSGQPRVSASISAARRAAKHFKFKGSNVVVPYLEYSRKCRDGKVRSYFCLFYRDETGARRRETRSTFAKAQLRAESIAKIIARGETNLLGYRQADHARYLGIQEISTRLGVTPEAALGLLEILVKRAGSLEALQEDARWGCENRPRGAVSRNVPDVVHEMLEQMERDQAGERWIDDLRSRLVPQEKKWKQAIKPFTQNFVGPIHELRAPAVNEWIGKLQLSPRSRNNYRTAILALVAFAREKTYLPKTWLEDQELKRVETKRRRILIYTPEQCTAYLLHARDNLIPFIAIQAFAGIRTREILGDKTHPPLDWRDLKLDKRKIYVAPDSAKEGTPDRIIPISENLADWLGPYARRSGPICSLANVTNALRRTAARAKTPFLRNGFRKSFISYRLALVKDIGQVAEEAGNSPQIIKTNYRDPREDEEGQRWFSISPQSADILQLNLGLA